MSHADVILSRQVRAGAVWGVLNIGLSRLIQFVTTIVVARIVAPDDFGALAVALAVSTIALNISELGATAAIGRGDREVGPIAPTVYSIALGTSAMLTALVWVTAAPLAGVMNQPSATDAIRVMSLTILLAGLCSVPSAVVWRDYQQRNRLIIDVTGSVVTLIVVIPMAMSGWGVMALAWSRVIGAAVAALLYIAMAAPRYRPGWDPTVAREVLRLGLPLAAANLVVFVTLNLDYVLLGRYAGLTEVGIYLLAFNLAALPSSVLTQMIRTVAVPTFGRLHAAGRLAEIVPWSIRSMAIVAFPISAVLAALAEPLLTMLYGPRFAAGAVALVWLAFFGAARVVTEVLSDVCLGAGRTRIMFGLQVLWLVALLPTLVVAIRAQGASGAGWAHLVVCAGIILPAYLVIVARATKARWPAMARAAVPGLIGAVAAGLVARLVADRIASAPLAVLAGGSAGAVVYVLVVWRELRDLTSSLITLRSPSAGQPQGMAS
ncbi:oligosaccharide flippase family protein [Kribbia dieselivorans]|uniref:oligosaccharide flippase family protein n=1 Tax=Kribbia dieselivorans TaxID=331526 RepID=UPI0008395C29|nr:oligosaccharide flippase family protein [Kribbia dieselivorans]